MNASRAPKSDSDIQTIERYGIRLNLGADGYHRDPFGIRYDVRGERLYRETGPGIWVAVRPPEPSCVLGSDGKPLF